ncbi:MAG: polymer-forming cytoskeletal protein [Candidatus Aminicenantes bacterium]|nr:polymer-forming cytoskeletal protein [Candidatus Aminicenantes bacterium]
MKDQKEKQNWNESKLSGFYDEGTEFQGELKFKGSFRIDGFFKGKINSDDMLIIGERGNVEAEVNVGYAVVNGEFHGRIQCKDKIEVHDHGRIFGTIIAPRITIAESAYLEAKCQTTDSASPDVEDSGKKDE